MYTYIVDRLPDYTEVYAHVEDIVMSRYGKVSNHQMHTFRQACPYQLFMAVI